MLVWMDESQGMTKTEHEQYVLVKHNDEEVMEARVVWDDQFPGYAVMHINVLLWNHSVARYCLDSFFELVDILKDRGFHTLIGANKFYNDESLEKWKKFVAMFGFRYIGPILPGNIHAAIYEE
jgi:hypothetical protein